MMWRVNPFALDPCPEEIAKYCQLIETPNYQVQGLWILVVSGLLWIFLHFFAKEAAAMALQDHALEREGRTVGINSHNWALVYLAARAMQILSIASGLVGLSRVITGR
jgi:membrane-associated PAP2 superfamily phosphatase